MKEMPQLKDIIGSVEIAFFIDDMPEKIIKDYPSIKWSKKGFLKWADKKTEEINKIDHVEVTNTFEMCLYFCFRIDVCLESEADSAIDFIEAKTKEIWDTIHNGK